MTTPSPSVRSPSGRTKTKRSTHDDQWAATEDVDDNPFEPGPPLPCRALQLYTSGDKNHQRLHPRLAPTTKPLEAYKNKDVEAIEFKQSLYVMVADEHGKPIKCAPIDVQFSFVDEVIPAQTGISATCFNDPIEKPTVTYLLVVALRGECDKCIIDALPESARQRPFLFTVSERQVFGFVAVKNAGVPVKAAE